MAAITTPRITQHIIIMIFFWILSKKKHDRGRPVQQIEGRGKHVREYHPEKNNPQNKLNNENRMTWKTIRLCVPYPLYPVLPAHLMCHPISPTTVGYLVAKSGTFFFFFYPFKYLSISLQFPFLLFLALTAYQLHKIDYSCPVFAAWWVNLGRRMSNDSNLNFGLWRHGYGRNTQLAFHRIRTSKTLILRRRFSWFCTRFRLR